MGSDTLGVVVGVGVAVTDGVGSGVADGAVLGVLLGGLLGVAVVLLGAGLGLSWVQATGPTRNAATNRAVMTGRRTGLLGLRVRRLGAALVAVHRQASGRRLLGPHRQAADVWLSRRPTGGM
ncbi:hypothetical protein OG819_42600 [Streptomyces sp. NBC_01549]|uniref:hypothetical protein n=1 Tax=Streptomyces sp. NBC_01549 TaxID=2975874 RepID=UPI0022568F04|nr:hypothetical protein [Streptomyces sp. NBC_01549]MCX4596107.1 hypothetical protein [Streptomyces sp. NBC_01549]